MFEIITLIGGVPKPRNNPAKLIEWDWTDQDTLALVIKITFLILIMYILQRSLSNNKEIEKKVEENLDKISGTVKNIDSDGSNVLLLMITHVRELRGYYSLTRKQAISSFIAALMISIIGVLIFFKGLLFSSENSISLLSTIAGAIVEIIAGLFFWLYSKALDQLSLFHISLQRSANVLLSIQLVDKISNEEKDSVYREIVLKIIDSEYKIEPK
ncbi:hypothetical protein FUA48_11610 [Flavobacterium alkalisoli]|uniref:Cyanobacterial TRADD-N associated 2 transmembrane domain-containing protein n=1 Tax=Flavobacterium alkalisoli TaxID=2602769 RepID=A0A5B9FT78_9FLAO|nr:hypothetical protein [Flavobacterium alkalisoli]QEE50200.1 hypothetical protein FUA48_11610 [Flavobacterium alkalisoli]